MGSLSQRVGVALGAIPVLLLLTFWDQTLPFKLTAFLGLLLALLEYLKMADRNGMKTLRVEAGLALFFILSPWLLRPWVAWDGHGTYMAGLALLSLSFLWSKRPLREMVTSVSVTFFGTAYFGGFGNYFLRLRDLPEGAWYLFWLYAATWAYDTGGYFAGHWWGRHRLAPLASPKKTLEGSLGGFLLVLACLFSLWKAVPLYTRVFTATDVFLLSALLSIFGQIGDLVESTIKRSLSAKDSGSLLPGHGGVFDRIDSLLFNAPVLFYYLLLFKH